MSTNPFEAALGTFFEEAQDMLMQMEHSVLELEVEPQDTEQLNALFRAAHTIKGSAGLFGLKTIVGFTHHVETVLDELRSGTLQMDRQFSSLLFACRDHIATLLNQAQLGSDAPPLASNNEEELIRQLQALLHRAQPVALDPTPTEPPDTLGGPAPDPWVIQVSFGPDTFRDGFDPLAMVGYLGSLGEIQRLKCELNPRLNLDELADYNNHDPESCHLVFEIHLTSSVGKAELENAFQFVLNDCQLSISPPPSLLPTVIEKLTSPPHPERLGDLLLASGAVTANELQQALKAQQASAAAGEITPLGEILVAQQATSPAVVDAALARQQRHREVAGAASEARMVRISADKLDHLINLVGELVIAGATSNSLAHEHRIPALVKNCKRINSLVEELRDGALSMRMVPIGETFARFRRVVRDVCTELGKDVTLELHGSEAELDKSVVEKIVDPLMHIVRNALDHGIEPPAERQAAGKPSAGLLRLSAKHDSGMVVIQISDDGRGLNRDRILTKALERGLIEPGATLSDKEINGLIFAPGFSTAQAVTKLSGRGVGMDVVKRNIESLRGTVEIHSQFGQGTTIEIRLPLTLAIIDGFLVRVGHTPLVLPLDMVVECINSPSQLTQISGSSACHMALRGSVLPVIHLRHLFKLDGPRSPRQSVIVVRSHNQRAGLVVDTLAGEHQTVIKPLGRMFKRVKGVGGSTILGTGEVALILDVPALVQLAAEIDAQTLSATATQNQPTHAEVE